jgi:ABC-2 type transport system permease protein
MSGIGALSRLILRRDRRIMPIWVIYLGIIPPVFVVATGKLFPTKASLDAYAAASAHNPGFVALYTQLFGSSLGEVVAWRMASIPVIIGLFSLLTVIRHTRTEEQNGRRELIGSTAVGRSAGLAAATITTCVACAVLGIVVAIGMMIAGQPAGGCWLYGAGMAAVGWVFAGVGAVAAQLTSNGGSARGIAITVLGAADVLRAAGDVSAIENGNLAWLSWLSPIGWAQHTRPYYENVWWPLALSVGATLVLVFGAAALSARRDLGAGLLPPRLGPATAGPLLHSPLGLAWRLHRGLLAGWAAGFAVLGLLLGYLAGSIGSIVTASKSIETLFQHLGGTTDLTNSYLAVILSLFGMIAGAYGIQAMLRARTEEASGRLEPVLGTATGRYRWLAGHLLFALLGPAVTLAVGGVGMGLANGLNTHDVGGQVSSMVGSALTQLPAVWVLATVTVVLFGLFPKASAGGWAALGICFLLNMVGTAAGLSHWVLDISPYTHLPHLPGGTVPALPLIVLVAVSVVLAVVGAAGFRRRSLPVG